VSPKRTPSSPPRAKHRIMRSLLSVNHKEDKVQATPEELDRVARVFARAKGSWERLFKGSVKDLNLLRLCLKVAVKKGAISKAPKWE